MDILITNMISESIFDFGKWWNWKSANMRWFYNLYEQKFSNLRPFLAITFPKGFRKSKFCWHWTVKWTVKWSEKVWRTDRHTDISTNGKNRPIGLILWKYGYQWSVIINRHIQNLSEWIHDPPNCRALCTLSVLIIKKIPHTEDKESLDQCG